MVKVSVILAAYNEEKYIKKAIESVLNQTLDDFELIIVDDGSTDATSKIINSFDDLRIKTIFQTNLGPGASRNNALDIASGDYVTFLDGDDWYGDDLLEIAYGEASKNSTDMTFFQMINYNNGEVYENDWFSLKSFDDSFEDRVFEPSETPGSIFDLSVGVCQKIYNREFLRRIEPKHVIQDQQNRVYNDKYNFIVNPLE